MRRILKVYLEILMLLGEKFMLAKIACLLVGTLSLSAMAIAQDKPVRNVILKDTTASVGLTIATDQACWVDINNDGWVDLITSGSVWKNNAGSMFSKIADVGMCVSADFDNDGYVDLFSWSSMKLYRNNQGGSFTEVMLPKMPATVSRGACWGDFNGDGFVDLYIGGYEDWNAGITYPSMILMNQKGHSLKLVWTQATNRSRGVTCCDFDQDSDMDIYVSNYRLQPNQLWLNDGNGKFKDVAAEWNAVATSPGFDGGHSIGSAWADFDNDGLFDLFAGNFAHVDNRGDQPKSRFLRNLGPKSKYHFQDMGTCGVSYQESYATPAAGDYDNDGNLDLFFTTVYGVASFGKPNYPVLYRNQGGFVFSDMTAAAGVAQLPPTYQAAWADFNNDGCLDLIAGGKLFVNAGNGNHWLKVRLTGDGQVVNLSAIGAQARVLLKGKTQSRQVEAGTGEGNQNDLTLHFGLGQNWAPVSLEIRWPNGDKQVLKNVMTDRLLSIQYKPVKKDKLGDKKVR